MRATESFASYENDSNSVKLKQAFTENLMINKELSLTNESP